MPNYTPMEETSLVALLAALRGGMTPTTGYQMFQDVLDTQAQRVDERQQRLASLQDLLASQAVNGQSLEGAQALADAYSRGSNVPPMIEETIDALYPTTMEPQPMPMVPSPYAGSTPSEVGAGRLAAQPMQGPPTMEPVQAQVSPAAPPVDPVAALQQEAAAYQAQADIEEATAEPEATLGDVIAGINAARNQGTDPGRIRQNVMSNPEAAELVAKNYSALSKLFPNIFPDQTGPGGA